MHIAVSPEQVFDALNTDAGRAAFWAESAAEHDGAIVFQFINGVATESRILERERPQRFAIEYFGTVARFELTPDGNGGTDLQLTHHDVAVRHWAEVHAGWLNVLFPLKAWIVHGVDLRNHDRSRTWDEGYADQ